MKNKNNLTTIIIVVVITIIVIAGLIYFLQTGPSRNKKENKMVNMPTNEISYKNQLHGFNLKFPDSWRGFKVKDRKLEWEGCNDSNSIDFGFPQQNELLNISASTVDQEQCLKNLPESIRGKYLGKNDKYVFFWRGPQEYADKDMEAKMKDVDAIIKSFKIEE